jgi:RimJ/RimL family protein N-acetyltransferase
MDLVELTDGTILLRPFRPEDAEAHLAGEDDEQVRWLSGGRATLSGVRAWIEASQRADGSVFTFAIVNAQTRALVGMVEARTDHEAIAGLSEGDANISYGLYPIARGQGYASRAVALVMDFLQSRGLRQAVIRVDPRNTSSARVAQRLGYQHIGQTPAAEDHTLDIYVRPLDQDREPPRQP